jgi:hypothetical protein
MNRHDQLERPRPKSAPLNALPNKTLRVLDSRWNSVIRVSIAPQEILNYRHNIFYIFLLRSKACDEFFARRRLGDSGESAVFPNAIEKPATEDAFWVPSPSAIVEVCESGPTNMPCRLRSHHPLRTILSRLSPRLARLVEVCVSQERGKRHGFGGNSVGSD